MAEHVLDAGAHLGAPRIGLLLALTERLSPGGSAVNAALEDSGFELLLGLLGAIGAVGPHVGGGIQT